MADQPSSMRPRYVDAVADFSLGQEAARLLGDLETGVNACVECCDRYCGDNRIALRWIASDGHLEEYTFEQLKRMSENIAAMLIGAEVGKGDVVAVMLPRTPALVATLLAVWRIDAVYQPLFTAFGPKAIEDRIRTTVPRLVVTNSANRSKLDGIDLCPKVATLVADATDLPDGDLDVGSALRADPGPVPPVTRHGDDLLLMMSTSGTTGLPKGVPVPIWALPSFAAYMRQGIDLRADDVFWNIADPGWAYGLY